MKGLFLFFLLSTAVHALPKKSNIINQTVYVRAVLSSGSGVIIGPNKVLTAAHVCDGALEIMTTDGSTFPALNTTPDEPADLCIITTEGLEKPKSIARLSGANSLVVGTGAWFSGFPLGAWRISWGMIRKEGWYVEAGSTRHYEVDTVCDPGNSGGPAYNALGDLVGIVVRAWQAPDRPHEGFCLLVPIPTIRKFLGKPK